MYFFAWAGVYGALEAKTSRSASRKLFQTTGTGRVEGATIGRQLEILRRLAMSLGGIFQFVLDYYEGGVTLGILVYIIMLFVGLVLPAVPL